MGSKDNKIEVNRFFHYGSGDYCAYAKLNDGPEFRVFYINHIVSLESSPHLDDIQNDEAIIADVKKQCAILFRQHDAKEQGYVD